MQEGIAVQGIVLSSMPIGEADRRILLLTKELGKISAFSRGARRPTSSMIGAARPFAFGTFYLHNGRSAYTVQKAEISEYFEDLVLDVEKSAYGMAFMELAGYFSRENEDGTAALSLLYYALRALRAGKIPGALIQTIYECRMLTENGLFPDFSVCPKCGKPLKEGVFLPALMQPVCRDCAKEASEYPLQGSTVYAFQYIRTAPLRTLFGFNVSDSVLRELRAVAEILLRRNTDRPLPAREMLQVLAPNS